MRKVLVTGGCGYIGSHTVVELMECGYTVVVADNLSNSKEAVLDRINTIVGAKPMFYCIDLCDVDALRDIFAKENFTDIIHFAGFKAVGESVHYPLKYYQNNLMSTLNLIRCAKEFAVKNIVFSSSATVYGLPKSVPITEDFPLSATNPYGQTKLMIEQIFKDFCHSDKSFNVALLRYFNPVGAHESGLIGEDPNGIPNNLVPYITQVAIGRLDEVRVFGNDYPTRDGTGVRDYIHVVDLAKGHIAALRKLQSECGLVVYNLGTGHGYSVLEVISEMARAVGRSIKYRIVERREGDVAECYADCSLAKNELGWKSKLDLRRMAEDSWRWQSKNPYGLK
ncbi:MAG: UDP-glucose 4-epimerase GalE [Clostridia bacterium]